MKRRKPEQRLCPAPTLAGGKLREMRGDVMATRRKTLPAEIPRFITENGSDWRAYYQRPAPHRRFEG
jgi:hypothetical protein